MNKNSRCRRVWPTLLLLLLTLPGVAFAKGRLGFGVEVATDGMLSTTVRAVKVASLRPDGPAALSGLQVGDMITQLDGLAVAGTSGGKLKDALGNIKQGQHLKLLVTRNGKAVAIDIVAGPDQ